MSISQEHQNVTQVCFTLQWFYCVRLSRLLQTVTFSFWIVTFCSSVLRSGSKSREVVFLLVKPVNVAFKTKNSEFGQSHRREITVIYLSLYSHIVKLSFLHLLIFSLRNIAAVLTDLAGEPLGVNTSRNNGVFGSWMDSFSPCNRAK